MTRALTGICTASLLALTVVGCGSGGPPADSGPGRPFEASYEIRLDPDRTLRVDLQGEFTAWEDKSEADAGKTDILVHTTGKAEVTDVSDGRDTDDFKQGFELFLPVTECPNWGDGDDTLGTHCNYDI